MSDSSRLAGLIEIIQPDEVYNLAAQSHVRVSFDEPEYTGDVSGLGSIRILEAIKRLRKPAKFYQASSSELFGSQPPPQSELTTFHPRSPYAAAKAYSFFVTQNYRESYGLFASNGILFNHESPRRGETFVTRKITRAVARIRHGLQKKLFLGNLDAVRDWGYAPEYAVAMWRMLQLDEPTDLVVSTGFSMSVKQFAMLAFEAADLDWEEHVNIDPRYYRPAEVDALVGDSSKAKRLIGWEAETLSPDLVRIMTQHDIDALHSPIQDSPKSQMWLSEKST